MGGLRLPAVTCLLLYDGLCVSGGLLTIAIIYVSTPFSSHFSTAVMMMMMITIIVIIIIHYYYYYYYYYYYQFCLVLYFSFCRRPDA